MRLKLFTVLNFVVRYQSICFACFIKKCFGRVILKTGVKPRFLMSPVLKSVFFINPVRVLWRQVRLFSKVSPSVESGFFSSPGFVRVRVRVRVSQYAEYQHQLLYKGCAAKMVVDRRQFTSITSFPALSHDLRIF